MFFRKKSPENTNNNTEQAPSDNNAESDYPAFDPEAAKRRIAEYKAAHPNAVDDVDKAYEMAKAEDPYRTEAADYRKGAKMAWNKVHENRQKGIEAEINDKVYEQALRERLVSEAKEKALKYEKEARINDSDADRIGQATGERYDLDRLSPEAKEELKQKRIAEYKAAHPNAVDDVDKAYEMAKAENPYRVEAVNRRELAKYSRERRRGNTAMMYEEVAKTYDATAKERGEEAGRVYDEQKITPESVEAARRKHIAEYKAAHPNAVDDVDKAYEMAKAEDPYRTEAAEYRRGERLALERTRSYRREQMDPSLNERSREYNRIMADDNKKRASEYGAEANRNDSIAEIAGQNAGKKYDAKKSNLEAGASELYD